MKQQRWYDIQGSTLYVYDSPIVATATLVNIGHVLDLHYYKSTFQLRRIWSYE